MIILQATDVCSYTILTHFASHVGLIFMCCVTAFALRDLPLALQHHRLCCLFPCPTPVQVTIISIAQSVSIAICYEMHTHRAYVLSSLLRTVLFLY